MKKVICLYALSFSLLLFLSFPLYAQDALYEKDNAFSFEASYIGDEINNFSGGIHTGSSYLGMANLRLRFDTQSSGLWNGGQFYVNAANIHGSSPSSELLGDMQVASNIDAGNHTYIQELWYKQALGKVELTAGLQDLNVEFANSAYGSIFMNSSFGILPVISTNISAPIFPLTTLGVTAKWALSEKISLLGAIYDGTPTDFDYNPYNINWHLASEDGFLAISELQYNVDIATLPGTYKVGAYSHNHMVENATDSLSNNIFGLYVYADQKVWAQNNKSLGMFAQLGYSPSQASINNYYLGLGLNYTGLFTKQGTDVLGLAIAHQHFTDGLKSETTIELTYRYQLTNNFFVQPDFQYIINPAGTGKTLNNCCAGNLRFGISF